MTTKTRHELSKLHIKLIRKRQVIERNINEYSLEWYKIVSKYIMKFCRVFRIRKIPNFWSLTIHLYKYICEVYWSFEAWFMYEFVSCNGINSQPIMNLLRKKNNGPRLIDPTVSSWINVSKRNRFHRKPMQMFKDALETKSIDMFVFFINTSVILFHTLVNLMIIFNYSRYC